MLGVLRRMKFESIQDRFEWAPYQGQKDRNVTYVFVANEPIGRLRGSSDILYIGKTEQSIAIRYVQETSTNNSGRNTQQTNIRMTHVLGEIGPGNYHCYFVKSLNLKLSGNEKEDFLKKLRTWDKKYFLKITQFGKENEIEIPIEKYLLVRYAAEHLEVPPMNNSL
jgi:hypothetical protein